MKKLLGISLLLISQLLNAQDDRLLIKFKGGIAIPRQEFSESSPSEGAGFAENGFIGGIGLGIPIAKNAAFDFDLLRASYKVNEVGFLNTIRSDIRRLIPGSSIISPSGVGNYSNTNAFASLRLMAESNGTFFYVKPGVGASWLNIPTVSVNIVMGQDRATVITSYESSVTLMFNLAAGILVELNDNISLDIGGQYLFSNFDVSASIYAEDNSGNFARTNEFGNVKFTSLNLTLGLVFYIKRND